MEDADLKPLKEFSKVRMNTLISPSAPELINIGDTVSVSVREYRKWWQLWKPKSWHKRRLMTVTSTHVRILEGCGGYVLARH